MLGVLTRGRLDVGIDRGLKPPEFDAFCLSQADSRPMVEEFVAVMRRVWSDEPFHRDGAFFRAARSTPLSPPLVQRPAPPLWISALSEESLRWAAEQDLIFGQIDSFIENCRRDCETYRAIQVASGHAPEPRLFLTREVYVAETDERAREEAYEYLLADWDLWNRYSQFARDGRLPASYAAWSKRAPVLSAMSFEQLVEQGIVLVGSPETVADVIRRHQEQIPLAVLVCVMQIGPMPHEMVSRSMRMFADRVMPGFRDGHAPRQAARALESTHA